MDGETRVTRNLPLFVSVCPPKGQADQSNTDVGLAETISQHVDMMPSVQTIRQASGGTCDGSSVLRWKGIASRLSHPEAPLRAAGIIRASPDFPSSQILLTIAREGGRSLPNCEPRWVNVASGARRQMMFDELGLRPELIRAVSDAGYSTPTPIQARAIPVALDRKDLIACAQTGTGKTAAFLLPVLQRLAAGERSRHPRALIVSPTRELAAQIGEMALLYGGHLRVRSTVIFGGVGMEPQTRRLRRGLDLLIATPGRLLDHLGRKQVYLGNVEVVVLDEADRMLDMGFLPDIRRVLAVLPVTRQNLFFSATMPGEIEELIRRTANDPTTVEVTPRATPVSAIQQVVHPVAMTRKKDLLASLLKRSDVGQALVFTRTKARANQLVRRLEHSGRRVAAIHGNKSQSARTRALDGFRSGRIDTLIATDIAARGIDVDGISHVVNFDLPNVPEDYVHRIGRTARAGSSGSAISLAAPEERAQLAAIERLVGKAIPSQTLAGFEVGPSVAGESGKPARRRQGAQRRYPGMGSARPVAADGAVKRRPRRRRRQPAA